MGKALMLPRQKDSDGNVSLRDAANIVSVLGLVTTGFLYVQMTNCYRSHRGGVLTRLA